MIPSPVGEEDSMTQDTTTVAADTITERVRARYAQAAQWVQAGGGCCASMGVDNPITRDLYGAAETEGLPEEAILASLGCGNPTALAALKEGQTVLDLGSGGGIDVLLSARRVGPTGFVYGVDMTDEMLTLAQANKEKAGITNVAFLKGRIEEIPLPANAVDVVISNCVINLAVDKSLVLNDAFRVLKPGGRFAVADVVSEGPVPPALRQSMEAWVGCIAGALDIATYTQLLQNAGFEDVSIEVTRRYRVADAGIDTSTLPAGWEEADGKIMSAFVRATKPLDSETNASTAESELPVSGTGCGCSPSCCH